MGQEDKQIDRQTNRPADRQISVDSGGERERKTQIHKKNKIENNKKTEK